MRLFALFFHYEKQHRVVQQQGIDMDQQVSDTKLVKTLLKMIPDESFFESAFRDILSHVDTSLQNLKNEEERALFHRFWSRHNGDGTEIRTPTSEPMTVEGLAQNYDSRSGHSALVGMALMFYLPHYKQCPADRRFPSACPYEVIIPYAEADEHLMKVYVFPSGLDPGDRAVRFHTSLPSHTSTSDMETLSHAFCGKKVFDSSKLNVLTSKMTSRDIIDRASIGWGCVELPQGPLLRLPCYNIPWQCLYEKFSDDLGDFWQDSLDLKELFLNKPMSKYKPISDSQFLMLYAYPLWNLVSLTNQEMLEHLHSLELSSGKSGSYKNAKLDSFIKSRDRLFKDFFKNAHKPKVIKAPLRF
jgi:hypothetical protein